MSLEEIATKWVTRGVERVQRRLAPAKEDSQTVRYTKRWLTKRLFSVDVETNPWAQPLPPKTLDDEINNYLQLVQQVGGHRMTGRALPFRPPTKQRENTRIEPYIDVETTHASHIWTEKDRHFRSIPLDDRTTIEEDVLRAVNDNPRLKNADALGFEFDASLSPDEKLLQYEYAKDFLVHQVLPLQNWIDTLPPELQDQAHIFRTRTFLEHIYDEFIYTLSDHLVKSFVYPSRTTEQSAEGVPDSQILIPSIAFTESLVGIRKAPQVAGRRKFHLHKTMDYFPKQNREASGAWEFVKRKVFHKHNRYIGNEFDYARYVMTDDLYGDPKKLGAFIEDIKLLASHHPERTDECRRILYTIARNAKKLGLDVGQFMSAGKGGEVGEENASIKYAELQPLIPFTGEAEDILHMLRDRFALVERHKERVAPHHKPRTMLTKEEKDSGKYLHGRNEGALHMHDEHYERLEDIVNEKSNIIMRLVHRGEENIIDLLGNVGGLRFGFLKYIGFKGIHTTEHLARELLEDAEKHPGVRPNYLGGIAWFLTILLAKKAYRNIKDNADFFNPIDAVQEVAIKLRTNPVGLLNDLREEKKIPDEPNTATVEESEYVSQVLNSLKPLYLQPPRKQKFKFADHFTTSSDWGKLRRIMKDDYIENHDDVQILTAMGMLWARVGNRQHAIRYLTMAGTSWAEEARRRKLPVSDYQALALHELSQLYTNEEQSEAHLMAAFGAYARRNIPEKNIALDQPQQIAAHILQHPLNYEFKAKVLEENLLPYSRHERLAIASEALAEVEAIGQGVAMGYQLPDDLNKRLHDMNRIYREMTPAARQTIVDRMNALGQRFTAILNADEQPEYSRIENSSVPENHARQHQAPAYGTSRDYQRENMRLFMARHNRTIDSIAKNLDPKDLAETRKMQERMQANLS